MIASVPQLLLSLALPRPIASRTQIKISLKWVISCLQVISMDLGFLINEHNISFAPLTSVLTFCNCVRIGAWRPELDMRKKMARDLFNIG
jgi:hypothetical protein